MDDAGERDVLLDLFDFDGWLLARLHIRYDHDVAPLDLLDVVALVADRLDRHVTDRPLVDGWSLGLALAVAVGTVGGLGTLVLVFYCCR